MDQVSYSLIEILFFLRVSNIFQVGFCHHGKASRRVEDGRRSVARRLAGIY